MKPNINYEKPFLNSSLSFFSSIAKAHDKASAFSLITHDAYFGILLYQHAGR
jgi:hypothetical protein